MAAIEPRRTKRRYAHELYPHPDEGEARDLAIDVPYKLAMALGTRVEREWHDLIGAGGESVRIATDRTQLHLAYCEIALIAAALHEGLAGQDAWNKAQEVYGDDVDEHIYAIATRYGIDPDAIRPYAIRNEPDTHQHWSDRDPRGWRTLLEYSVNGKESECPDCTEPFPEGEVPSVQALYKGADIAGWFVDHTRDTILARRLVLAELTDPNHVNALEHARTVASDRWIYTPTVAGNAITLHLTHAEPDTTGTFPGVRFAIQENNS